MKIKPGLVMKYFVLKPKGIDQYARASRMAMLVYAEVIQLTNSQLAEELSDWVKQERDKLGILQ